MKTNKPESSYESDKGAIFTPPVVEMLSDPKQANKYWPESVTRNGEFFGQLELRQELSKRLESVIACLPRPDTSLQEAVSQKYLTENQVAILYSSLNALLEESEDYRRIILYLPFEFLPGAEWQPTTQELTDQIEHFKSVYLSAWNDLLFVHDVRANFVDGDILEMETRTEDLPRVVKATHLIPKLIEKGLLDIETVFNILEKSDDTVLKQSTADTLPVLADMNLIHDEELARLQAYDNPFVQDQLDQIAKKQEKSERETDDKAKEITPEFIYKKLDTEFKKIDKEEHYNITKRREEWLRQEKKLKTIISVGSEISLAILNDAVSSETIADLIAPNADQPSQIALINGICMAIESMAYTDQSRAQKLYEQYRETLLTLWRDQSPAIRDAITTTFCRLHNLEIIKDRELEELNITIPSLAGPFSENLKNIAEEMTSVRNLAEFIESNPEVIKYIYPIVLVFGSKLKGYGTKSSDLDIGIFIRPETSPQNMSHVRAILKSTQTHENLEGEIAELWLRKTENGLAVYNQDEPEELNADLPWTHVLFSAAWEGNAQAITEARNQLIVPYFYKEEKTDDGRSLRSAYLETLERDTLQYRLMHKGYARYYPPHGGINTLHADQIDGQSMFWDSGYRQTATKLFASNVFIPKISKP